MQYFKALLAILVVFAVPAANAAVSDEDFAAVKQMLEEALQRISELEGTQAAVDTVQQAEIELEAVAVSDTAEQVAANTAAIEKMSWAERIRLQGDFRYRYQTEEQGGRLDDMSMSLDDRSRNRQRIRARAAILADLDDNIEVGLGVATGGDDSPVSANQTLGGAGSDKNLSLDLAYMDWKFADNSNLLLGKFKNQFVDQSGGGLLWDSDWRPEGFDVSYANDLIYANALGTWLAADGSSGSGSSFNYGVQVGVTPEIEAVKLDVGAGYYAIRASGRECYIEPSADETECFGNTEFNAAGVVTPGGGFYGMDYKPVQLYGKATIGSELPVSFFFDYAVNTDAMTIPSGPSAGKKLDTAYLVGASIGAAKKPGEWQFKAFYSEKEADSVVGLLTNSNFGGGGTDSKGFALRGTYVLTNTVYVQATYFDNERLDSNGYENGSLLTSNPYDVDILQLDVQFKYK